MLDMKYPPWVQSRFHQDAMTGQQIMQGLSLD